MELEVEGGRRLDSTARCCQGDTTNRSTCRTADVEKWNSFMAPSGVHENNNLNSCGRWWRRKWVKGWPEMNASFQGRPYPSLIKVDHVPKISLKIKEINERQMKEAGKSA